MCYTYPLADTSSYLARHPVYRMGQCVTLTPWQTHVRSYLARHPVCRMGQCVTLTPWQTQVLT